MSAHRKYDDTRLGGTTDIAEERYTIQRGLDKFKRWAPFNPNDLQSAKFCTWFEVIPDVHTNWEKNYLRLAC